MKFCYFGRMAMSIIDCGSFIAAMCMRSRTMRIPAVEDWLYENLLIFEYFWYALPLGSKESKELERIWAYRGRELFQHFRTSWSLAARDTVEWRRFGINNSINNNKNNNINRDLRILGYHAISDIGIGQLLSNRKGEQNTKCLTDALIVA